MSPQTMGTGLSVRAKLMAIVLFMTLISASVGGFAYLGFSRTNSILEQISGQFIPDLALVDDTAYQLALARRYEKELFLFSSISKDEKVLKKQQGYYGELIERFKIAETKVAELKQMQSIVVFDGAQVVKQVETLFGATMASLPPLTDQLFAGKSFLEVAEEYGVYKKNVNDLEASVKTLRDKMLAQLDAQKVQVAEFRDFLNQTLLVAVLVVITLGIAIGLLFSRRISASISQLLEGIQSVGSGDFKEIQMTTRDEFGQIAQVFNQTMGRLQQYVRTDEQRKETERNLVNFLEIVSDAADGDLTGKVPVTADAFGSIADAYNMMVESLSELMADTRRKAGEVSHETQRLLDIFRQVESGVESQTQQLELALGAVAQTTEAAREIARQTALAQEVSGKVDAATMQGNARVHQNMDGMQLIRGVVQTINKKMKSLSERLLEIGTISELISEVATRTTILAMNASIEASRAGEQGRGFLVISNEIRKLADKSAEATKQIGGIIKAIQTEAGEVTAALEDETKTVEKQALLAKGTGEAFGEIEGAISESRAVVTEITRLSAGQNSQTEEVVRSMEMVTELTARTREMILDSVKITEGLNVMSGVLLGSVAQFKLPAGDLMDEAVETAIELEDVFTEEDPFAQTAV